MATNSYIKKTFKKRDCVSFVPYSEKSSELCQCGYMRDHHRTDNNHRTNNNILKNLSTWDVETNTETSETDAFGVVEFPAYGQKTSKFVRVDYKTNVDDLWNLMHDKWQMGMPHLLISVTGGARKLVMKPSLKEVFRKGLVEAAQFTGAWIITSGTNTGVMKEVSEAIRDHALKQGSRKQLVAIGMATWGCIENREDLIDNREALYKPVEPTNGQKESFLDPNHTHFILVDNGTRNQYGAEIELRAKLEEKISNMEVNNGKIPVVCIVIEGGKGTVETVKQAIIAKTPVIIVGGSGRAADVLAFAYNHYTPSLEDTPKQQEVKEALIAQIDKVFGRKKRDVVLSSIESCLENRNMITVFRLDDEGSAKNLDVAIITTLLRVKYGDTGTFEPSSLSLGWERFVKERIDHQTKKDDELRDVAFTAIVNNRVELVKFLLGRRLCLSNMQEKHKIEHFYREAMETNKHLKVIFKDAGTLDPSKLNNFISKLVDRLFDPANPRVKPVYQRQQPRSQGASKKSATELTSIFAMTSEEEATMTSEDVAIALFYWAILARMNSMALVFLYEAKETFTLSLIGHLMLKNLLKRETDLELLPELQKQVDFYEVLTTGLLAECYSFNQEMTIDLLVHETFAKRTALEIAVQANNQSFIAHQACQTVLKQIWMGDISDDNPLYKLLLCIPGFFLAPLLLKFREETSTAQGEAERSKANGDVEDQNLAGSSETKTIIVLLLTKQPSKPSASTSATTAEPDDPCSVYKRRFVCFVTAPFVKFSFNWVSYAVLLLLYSIILLTNFYPTISIAEYVLIFWVFSIVCEEIRQIASDRDGGSRKVYNYFSNKWNLVDVIAICTFTIGLALRLIPLSFCDSCFFAARIVLAVNLMTFYCRILHMFSNHRELGPKLVMIGKMMIDLLYFMTILLVFIVAYGIAAHVILYPNQELRLSLVRDVLSGAWWSVYGEFNIEEVSGENCVASAWQTSSAEDCASMDLDDFNRTMCPGKEEQCPAINWFVQILLAIYALITNVLMINLLIAMFSNTFAKVEGIADVVWKIQRYHLVLEYESHPILPPPLIVIAHAYLLIRSILRKLRKRCQKNKAADTSADAMQSMNTTNLCKRRFKMKFDEFYERDLMTWLNAIVEEYLLKRDSEDATADHLAKEANERIDQVLRKVEEIGDTRKLDERLKSIEEQMNRLIDQLSGKR